MKKVFYIVCLILFFIFNFGFAGENIEDIDGNEWISFEESYKYGLVTGILLGEYIVYENVFAQESIIFERVTNYLNNEENLEKFFKKFDLLHSTIKGKHCKDFNYDITTIAAYFKELLNMKKGSLNEKEQIILSAIKQVISLPPEKLKKMKKESLGALYTFASVGYFIFITQYKEHKLRNKMQKIFITGLPVGQIKDGLDEFYKDFSNRKIKVKDAIFIILRQINGEDEEVIKHIIRYLKTNNIENLLIKDEKGNVKNIIVFPP